MMRRDHTTNHMPLLTDICEHFTTELHSFCLTKQTPEYWLSSPGQFPDNIKWSAVINIQRKLVESENT